MTKVNAPFTDDQIESINGYQKSKHWHPFTCGKVHCSGILTATKNGMFCRNCGNWKQFWVHEFMADWEWKEIDELKEAAEISIEEFQRTLNNQQVLKKGVVQNEENGETRRDEV